jgi:hypothetical protein
VSGHTEIIILVVFCMCRDCWAGTASWMSGPTIRCSTLPCCIVGNGEAYRHGMASTIAWGTLVTLLWVQIWGVANEFRELAHF